MSSVHRRRRLPAMKEMWKIKSIQLILTVSFTLITVGVMLLVSILLYNKFSRTAERNAVLGNQQIVEQVNYNLDIYIKGMTEIFGLIAEKLHQTDLAAGGEVQDRVRQLETILSTRADLVSMTLFTKEGELLFGLPGAGMRETLRVKDESWFRSALDSAGHLTFSQPHIQNLYKGQFKWVVSMSKLVTLERNGQPVEAVLLADINFKTIDELCRRVSLGKKGYVYVIDEGAGNIVYHPQQQLIYIGLKRENVEQVMKMAYGSYTDELEGERRLITVQTVPGIGWKMVGVSYMDEIMTTRREISGFILWLLAVVILFVLLITAFMSARISRPIKRLERSMRKAERGDFNIQIPVSGEDEVGRLSRQFNVMVERIGQLMEQNIREQEAKRKSELEVLQSQINPHFLYNTLNSVVRMAGVGKSEDVITMITSLSRFFRISLSRGKTIIPVTDELEHIRNYLVIQKMRYKNQFEFRIHAEENVLPYRTLKLLLQPIVENAIYHGLEMMADPGRIEIDAAVTDGKLRFRVRDNGLGIRRERLEEIRRELYGTEADPDQAHSAERDGTSSAETGLGKPASGKRDWNSSQSAGDGSFHDGSGVGVKNVHERIRLSFGEPYGLEIDSEPEEGTTVTLWLPLLTDEGGGG